MDQFLTYKKGNLGPVFNSTAYIYIYIYIYIRCEVRFWPNVCHFDGYVLAQLQ